jgi:hypothetical protein
MEVKEIINIMEHALVSAPGTFEAIANGPVEGVNWCADRMPESWITAALMQAAHGHGLAALPEVRIRHDVPYFESCGRSLRPEDFPLLAEAGAKIDIFLGDRSSVPGLIRLRVAIEVKGPKSNWGQFHTDLERLREIRKVVSGEDQAVVFAYVTCPMLDDERQQHDRKLEDVTGLKLANFKVLPSLRRSLEEDGVVRRTLVYIHVLD